MKQKIFVYGVLRKGMYQYDLYLRDEDSFCSYGYIEGGLFRLIGRLYPAFLKEGHDMILGEIHEVSEDIIALIDENFHCYQPNDKKNEFHKEICEIYDQDKNIIDRLPVYVLNMDNPTNLIALKEPIVCGDFLQYLAEKQLRKKVYSNLISRELNRLFLIE